ncbi:cysteine desulfurase CsdA [candidate division BRC1 bacterium HGW-BRC1-1]|jgi:cysteine desulfurase/selenocysteine lyase|nr:MAG: cysteine desulfurase CsdA [candidate division BRC1 bacterium HGW-BRC1-1]
MNGYPLVYLDNAATTQKPRVVIDALTNYYTTTNANIHRGVHQLSQNATEQYEAVRETVRAFINARQVSEIIFVRGATEGINLVAQSLGRIRLTPGDEVVITAMEHHSNIVPWQMVCAQHGARLRVAPMNDAGELLWDEYESLLNEKTKITAFTQISNALGTINPVERMVEAARKVGAITLVDGAQSAPHTSVDVQKMGCDFFVFSGHKIYAPTGIGVLYGRRELLEEMPPYQGGGDMISYVTFEKTAYNELPYKFEAGTPNIAGTIGLGAALNYVTAIGLDRIAAHESELLAYGTSRLQDIDGLTIIGTAAQKAGVLSFILKGVHPHDIGTIMDERGIAIRTGHHCAQPVMDRYEIPATARASLGLYNTKEEIDALAEGIRKVFEVFT